MDTSLEIVAVARPFIDTFLREMGGRILYDIDKSSYSKRADGTRQPGRFLILRIKYQKKSGKLSTVDTLTIHEFTTSELEPEEATLKEAEAAVSGVPTPPQTPPAPPAPAPTPTPPPATTLQPPAGPPEFLDFVRYHGSPNVFDRATGRYISLDEAGTIPNFWIRIIYPTTPRPEVLIETDFALWDGKNLTFFPV